MQADYLQGREQGHTSLRESKLLYSCQKKLISCATHREVFPHHQEITRVILFRLILNDIIIHIKFLNDIIMYSKIV